MLIGGPTRREFFRGALAVGSTLLLDGPASALIAEAERELPTFGSADVTIFGGPDDGVAVLARTGKGTTAVLVDGLDVFNTPGPFVPSAGAYHQRNFDRQTLTFRSDPGPGAPALSVTGNPESAIRMQTGQIQLWHLVNMAPGLVLEIPSRTDFDWRVSARDDLPLEWANFIAPSNANAALTLAPGNRADLLVRAPLKAGMYAVNGSVNLSAGESAPRLLINVEVVRGPEFTTLDTTATSLLSAPELYPYPQAAPALADIAAGEITMSRKVTFAEFTGGVRGATEPVLRLALAEEWTVINTTSRQRVLHLPRSPFQIVEVFDPKIMSSPRLLPAPFDWADTIAVAATSGLSSLPGLVRIRFRGEQSSAVSPYVYRGGAMFRSSAAR